MSDTMNRRMFLKSAALGGAGMMAAGLPAAEAETAKPFKFMLFTDIHFSPNGWANDDPHFIDSIYARAEREGCQMVMQLGDMVHNVLAPDVKPYIQRYNDFRIPTHHAMGNHDMDFCPLAATMDAYRMEKRCYYHFDQGGFRFIVLDPNYTRVDGKIVHHERQNYFKWVKTQPFNVIPPEELEWLRATVFESPHPCVVFSHQSLERPRSSEGVWNKEDVRAIFREANAQCPRKVLLCACGHHHMDNLMFGDGIPFWELNGANFFSCGRKHACYPADYVAKRPGAPRNLAWKDALCAVVTLGANGLIRIEGTQSDYLFGVTNEKAGFPEVDDCGRPALPRIQSAEFSLGPFGRKA